jgi:hypothetical protein
MAGLKRRFSSGSPASLPVFQAIFDLLINISRVDPVIAGREIMKHYHVPSAEECFGLRLCDRN